MSTPTQSPVMPSSSSPAARGPTVRPQAVPGISVELHAMDDLGAVPPEVAGSVSEDERDRLSAELAGELARAGEELERRSRRLAVARLDQRPAVVMRTGLLGDVSRLLPRLRRRGALREQLLHLRRGGRRGVRTELRPLRRHIPNGQDSRRRTRLAKALVVLVDLVDKVPGSRCLEFLALSHHVRNAWRRLR